LKSDRCQESNAILRWYGYAALKGEELQPNDCSWVKATSAVTE